MSKQNLEVMHGVNIVVDWNEVTVNAIAVENVSLALSSDEKRLDYQATSLAGTSDMTNLQKYFGKTGLITRPAPVQVFPVPPANGQPVPQTGHAPAVPGCATYKPSTVSLKEADFQHVLNILRTQGVNKPNNSDKTLMQIHEMLLAAKVND